VPGTSRTGRGRTGAVAQSVDEDGDHALAVGESLAWYGPAQQGNGVQEVPGADVGTNLTGRSRVFEQRPEGGCDSLEEVAGQGVERRVARVKGRGESSLGPEELGVPVEPLLECFSWLVGRGQRRGRGGAGVYLVLKHGLDEVRALREVPVQRPDADAGQVGDLLGGRVHA
jgi:hypothetical protein